MATELTISENSLEEDEKYLSALLKIEIPEENEAGDNQIGVEKSNDEVAKKKADGHGYVLRNSSYRRLVKDEPEEIKRAAKNSVDDFRQIFRYLIQLLRNWPEERLQQMRGQQTHKILQLAQNEGLFRSLTEYAFEKRVRRIARNEKLLKQVVENEEDRRLILNNLLKLGIGNRSNVEKNKSAKICKFLIRLLRKWPEERIREMHGSALCKILSLGKEEGLFQSYSLSVFTTYVRRIVLDEKLLSRFVKNDKDKWLILDNLSKFGIGTGSRGVTKIHKSDYQQICQYLIQLLRNWPEKKLQQIPGAQIFKILKLAKKEGLFSSLTIGAFEKRVRRIVQNEELLEQVVENKEDRQLILDNLLKLGIGKRSLEKPDHSRVIVQFLIRLLRNWPEKKMNQMSGPTIHKILKLAKSEGLFKKMHGDNFAKLVRPILVDKKRLDELADNEEDKKLIFDNLFKFGIRVDAGSKKSSHDRACAEKPLECESRDARPNPVEAANSPKIDFGSSKLVAVLDKIDSGPSNRNVAPGKNPKVKRVDRFCPTKVDSSEKLSKMENELKELKEIMLSERQENKNHIQELSKKIDFLTDETKKQENFAYQQQTKIAKLENQNATLNYKLSSYRKYK